MKRGELKMKKILVLVLLVLCIGSIAARPAPWTRTYVAVHVSGAGQYYRVAIDTNPPVPAHPDYYPINLIAHVKVNELPTVDVRVDVYAVSSGNIIWTQTEYDVEVYPGETTHVYFNN